MIPYLIPLIICFIAAITYDCNKNIHLFKKFTWFFLFIYLILLVGLRFEVGGDTINYMAFYTSQKTIDSWSPNFADRFQPAYSLLCALTKTYSKDFVFFQFVHVIIVTCVLFWFIKKYSTAPFFSLFCLIFSNYIYFTTEILREILAVLVFLVFYKSYINRNWSKYIFGVFLACMFHYSAIVLLFIPLLRNLKFNKRFFYICIASTAGLYLCGIALSFLSNNPIIDKFNGYWGTNYGYLVTFLYFLRGGGFPFAFMWLMKYKFHRELQFENIICILIIFGCGAAINPLIFGRSVNYFIMFFIVAFGNYLGNAFSTHRRIIRSNAIVLITSFLITYSTYYLSIMNYMRYYPYCSILNPKHIERDNFKARGIY